MLAALLVRHCAPTLAGLKTGSLFNCPCPDEAALNEELRQSNRLFVARGLRAVVLRVNAGRALVYVYRPGQLAADLACEEARAILSPRGYDVTATPERAIVHLIARLGQSGDFPHEIGLFLGYPPCDVRGFIEHRAGGCKCCGCWKVYGDVAQARRCFASYKRCTRIYCGLYDRGVGLDQLAVAV